MKAIYLLSLVTLLSLITFTRVALAQEELQFQQDDTTSLQNELSETSVKKKPKLNITFGESGVKKDFSSPEVYVPGGFTGDEKGLTVDNLEDIDALREENRKAIFKEKGEQALSFGRDFFYVISFIAGTILLIYFFIKIMSGAGANRR